MEQNEEEVFDPYDMSLYSKPKSQQDSDLNNDQENNLSKTEKKVFNPYDPNEGEEDQKNINDEKSELKPKKKSKRKKTDENLSENIDLTKSAYDENNQKEITNEERETNNEEDEIDPPLLEELGINPQNIKNKIIGVITLKRIDKKFLEDSDMAGPLLIFLLFAFNSLLQYKINFGYIYGISVFGSILVFLLLNLMSKNDGILLYNTISVLGYCLIPIVLLSFIAVFLDMKNILELSGFMDNPIDKPYEVAVYKTSKTELKKLTIFGTTEEDVIDKLNKYMDDNYIYDLSKEEEIFYEITKTSENFILDDEENFEENKDEINENFCENNDCMSCKYYCHIAIFYNQVQSPEAAITYKAVNDCSSFVLSLSKLPQSIIGFYNKH